MFLLCAGPPCSIEAGAGAGLRCQIKVFYRVRYDAMSADTKHATDEMHATIGDDVRRHYAEARAGLTVSELAVLAGRHLSIQQCAGGHSVVAGGPCDHCGS